MTEQTASTPSWLDELHTVTFQVSYRQIMSHYRRLGDNEHAYAHDDDDDDAFALSDRLFEAILPILDKAVPLPPAPLLLPDQERSDET